MERRAEGCVWAQLMPVPLANAALRQANVERPQMSKTSSTQPAPYSSLHGLWTEFPWKAATGHVAL